MSTIQRTSDSSRSSTPSRARQGLQLQSVQSSDWEQSLDFSSLDTFAKYTTGVKRRSITSSTVEPVVSPDDPDLMRLLEDEVILHQPRQKQPYIEEEPTNALEPPVQDITILGSILEEIREVKDLLKSMLELQRKFHDSERAMTEALNATKRSLLETFRAAQVRLQDVGPPPYLQTVPDGRPPRPHAPPPAKRSSLQDFM